MTPERLESVKAAGYVGGLSAYGGSIIARIDRYNVLRRRTRREYSDLAFMYEFLGYPMKHWRVVR